jgi:hypothetical protein
MHINEVRSILSDSFSSGVNAVYELKNYNDHQCCNSDFVLLYNHQEYAYIKFDNTGKMTKEKMGIHEEKMGTAYFYIIVKDTDDFIPTNLPCKVYVRNAMKTPLKCDTSTLQETLMNNKPSTTHPIAINDLADYYEKTYSSLIRGRMQVFTTRIREVSDISEVIEDYGAYFTLKPYFEQMFFRSLLGSVPEAPKRMCRYTSLSGLFRMLSERKQSMCSVACMNDKTETDYATSFLNEAFSPSNLLQRLEARSGGNQTGATHFILSGSRMSNKDDLNMWRLYGDDSKGVCLWYDVAEKIPDNFLLAKVSYGKKGSHPELSYLASKLSKSVSGRNFEIRNLHSWLHFFKPAEYAIEEETRLLFELDDINRLDDYDGKWILDDAKGIIAPIVRIPVDKTSAAFPLTLSKIVLGSNLPERDLNRQQLLAMINQCQITVSSDFEIIMSSINSYRS